MARLHRRFPHAARGLGQSWSDRASAGVRRHIVVSARVAAATAYVTSLLLAALDTHIVNIMLPTLTRDFHTSLESVKWTVLGYVLCLVIAMPVASWLSARFGERRVFVWATLMFVVASAGCGLAQNLPELVAVRALQGLAGGLVGPLATAMLYRTYPQHERARMTRLLLMPVALGPALAPPLGGFLVDHLSWRVAFFLNAPIGLTTAAMVLLGLEASDGQRTRLNFGCFASAAVGLSGLLYVLGEAPETGWREPHIVVIAIVALAAIAAFITLEFRVGNPLIDLRLFREPVFRFSNLATAFQTLAFLGGMYYITPLLLQEVGGRSPFVAGLVLTAVPIGVVTSTQTIGRAYDAIGPRRMVAFGQGLLAVTLLVLSSLDARAPIWAFCIVMFFAGLTNGMGMVSLQATMFANIGSGALARGATVLNINRQVATAIGVGVATAVITAGSATGPAAGGPYRVALVIAACFSVVAALAGLALPGHAAHRASVLAAPELVEPAVATG